jgi:predicted RNase H-like nuclease
MYITIETTIIIEANIMQYGFTSVPEYPEVDEKGLMMQMIYFKNMK